MEELEISAQKIFPGDLAWIALAAGIITYDVFAVLTQRAETLSSAIWKSLKHPVKSPVAAGIWLSVTWHLFFNKQAREAYGSHIDRIQTLLTNR